MPTSKGVIKTIVMLSVTGILGACGGGGGGSDGGSSGGIAASDPVTVSAANAEQVASATLDASSGLAGNTAGAFALVPAAVGDVPSGQTNVIETIIDLVKKAPSLLPGDSSMVKPAAVESLAQNCDSGTVSGSFNDADNDLTLSTGDTINMTANNCTFGDVIMNGSLSISHVVVSGDEFAPPYSIQFTLQATNFSVSSGGEVVVLNGGGTIGESTNDDISFTSTFSGKGIELAAGGDSLILTDYNIQETENQATGEYSISINGTISSSNLGGSVTVTTDITLTGVGAFDADVGQITCVGAGNTSVTLIAVDSLNVRLEVDENGDGTVDQTLSAAWSDL
jgi:hypothetical protein